MSTKAPTQAELSQQAAEIGLEHFRESFLLCFRTMADGIAEQKRKEAQQVIRFFETETDQAVWARLNTEAPEIAKDWLDQWAQLNAALGKPDPGMPLPTAGDIAQHAIRHDYTQAVEGA